MPLKTYLPDEDLDFTAFCDEFLELALATKLKRMLEEVENTFSGRMVKDVELILAQVKVVKCIVQDSVVKICFNQIVLSNNLVSSSIQACAVRTWITSSYWEIKWTSLLQNFYLDTKAFSSQRFRGEHILNKIIRKLNSFHGSPLQSFHIKCSDSVERLLFEVYIFLGRHVKPGTESIEVRLEPDRYGRYLMKNDYLPWNILHWCTSLKNLVLHVPCTLVIDRAPSFGSLTRLSLKDVKITSLSMWEFMFKKHTHDADYTLVLQFPVVEEIELEECLWWGVKVVEIKATRLTKFKSRFLYDTDINHVIKIYGANLTELEISGRYPERVILMDSTVDSASIGYWLSESISSYELAVGVWKQVTEFSSVRWLTIYDFIPGNINPRSVGEPVSPQHFQWLERLSLYRQRNAKGGLVELLKVMPVLRLLSIEIEGDDNYDYDAIESVPTCLTTSLEKIVLEYSEDSILQYNLEMFLLENGTKLKTVLVSYKHVMPLWFVNSAASITARLCQFPKASGRCEIRES